MPLRYLFGPVTAHFADQNLHLARASGTCLAFNPQGDADLRVGPDDTWDDVVAHCPAGWRPDAVVIDMAYTSVPACLWSAPVPLIGLAGDWNLLWHYYRRVLPLCEAVLTDVAGVEVLARQGIAHARRANLYGCERVYVEGQWPDASRDIDVLFVGNLNTVVQRERMAWLGRLAALANRWQVVIREGVHGADYRALLARSRVVFNRSIRGESNLRAFEAAAAGALLFQEAGNRETPAYFRDGQECVYYTDDDLEARLDYHLTHEERREIAVRGRSRARGCSFAAQWAETIDAVEGELPRLQERMRNRPSLGATDRLLARLWQALGANQGKDPTLEADLAAAAAAEPQSEDLQNALGVAVALSGPRAGPEANAVANEAASRFQRAVSAEPRHAVASLNLVEALVRLGHNQLALDGARHTLTLLQRSQPAAVVLDAPHYPPGFDSFRVEWERAAWQSAGRPGAEARLKSDLIRWRLHTLLGDLAGDLIHYHEAALARPDLPLTRALLGCALGRAGRPAEAVPHLRQVVATDPFDAAAARALHQALRDSGDEEGAARLAGERLLLRRAAPQRVAAEQWFAEPAPVGGAGRSAAGSPSVTPCRNGPAAVRRPRVSLCLIVRDEEANLPACLSSVADLIGEIVVIDTGSTDGTKEVAAGFGASVHDFPWGDDFAAARNEGLRHATGEWIFWLDADDRLDEDNRRKLRALFEGLKDENAAYVMKCLCLPDRATGAATVVDHVRLFRNRPDIQWEYRVHEQILPSIRRIGGEVRWADVVIHHSGYQDPGLRARKLERDLRLLRLETAVRPDDPFTLFNLGSVYHELGRTEEAIPALRRSLAKSHPSDSIVRKLYALLVQCRRALGETVEAQEACREGRRVCPDDPELLFLESNLLRERGDLEGAKARLRELLESRPGRHFASVDAGLRGYKARHNLAVILQQQGRPDEAEAQWRSALAERPDFTPGWLGLGEAALKQPNWELLEEAVARLETLPRGPLEAAVLRARGLLARRDFFAARTLMEGTASRFPHDLAPRVLLTHVLLQEGRDMEAAEKALHDVLALAPDHAEARHNLELVLKEKQRRSSDAAFLDNVALAQMYEAACRTPSDIKEHIPTLYALARGCRHVTEFGAGVGVSTAALLYAQPDRLVCYDRIRCPQMDRLAHAAGRTEFVFHEKDVLRVEIEETDLLFIDTCQVHDQLAEELRRHAAKVRKYIVLHGSTPFRDPGEAEGRKGLRSTVEELLAQGVFRLKMRFENNSGWTVLETLEAVSSFRVGVE